MILEFQNSDYLLCRSYEILVFILFVMAELGRFLMVPVISSGARLSGLPSFRLGPHRHCIRRYKANLLIETLFKVRYHLTGSSPLQILLLLKIVMLIMGS